MTAMRTFVVAGLLLAGAGSASAQNLKLEFHEGRVSIDAAGVPVRTILAEWARLGGTKVVGGDRITGAPLTIHLEDLPEAQALEIVLRNVAG
jgi:type II secretory pathway component HofQ